MEGVFYSRNVIFVTKTNDPIQKKLIPISKSRNLQNSVFLYGVVNSLSHVIESQQVNVLYLFKIKRGHFHIRKPCDKAKTGSTVLISSIVHYSVQGCPSESLSWKFEWPV